MVAIALSLSCGQLLGLDEYNTVAASGGNASGVPNSAASGGNGGSGGWNNAGASIGGAGGTECVLPDRCGVPVSPGGGTCAAHCDNCDDDTCTTTCNTSQPCNDQTLVCPAGFDCAVNCSSLGCENTTVVCPAGHRCQVSCNWEDACLGLDVVCNNGPCELNCQANGLSCTAAQLFCACNSCSATCEVGYDFTNEWPLVDCGESCDCHKCEDP